MSDRISSRMIAKEISWGTIFDALALVKLARLDGVASIRHFTPGELRRLLKLSKGDFRGRPTPTFVRFFKGVDGRSVEMTGVGWREYQRAIDAVRLNRE